MFHIHRSEDNSMKKTLNLPVGSTQAKNLDDFFVGTDEVIFKCTWNCKAPEIDKVFNHLTQDKSVFSVSSFPGSGGIEDSVTSRVILIVEYERERRERE